MNSTVHLPKIIESMRFLEDYGAKGHLEFIAAAVLHRNVFLKLANPDADSPFARLMEERPRYITLLTAPYIDARWSSSERVDHFINHAATLRDRLKKYDFPVSQSLQLLDLGAFGLPNYHVVIDKPVWFLHEGLLTINLFKNNVRFFSLTFSFCTTTDGLGIIIGGIQGRKIEGVLAEYRYFTKIALGLRPRDFLVELLRMIARAENVSYIVGVPDRFRYHRHRYFRSDRPELSLDYDQIWGDRGGVPTKDGMCQIPLRHERKLSQVAPKKRSRYRRRFVLLEKIEARLALELLTAAPSPAGMSINER